MDKELEFWISTFRSYIPAQQAPDHECLLEAAQLFKEVNPECPFRPITLLNQFVENLN
jgi:hypothetical protein